WNSGNYFVYYTFVSQFGETAASPPLALTVTSGKQVQFGLPALPAGAQSINLYANNPGAARGTGVLQVSGITATTAIISGAFLNSGLISGTNLPLTNSATYNTALNAQSLVHAAPINSIARSLFGDGGAATLNVNFQSAFAGGNAAAQQ